MLFSPIKVGSLEIRNRIVFPPMGTSAPDGEVCQTQINYYARRAEGGAGLIVIEYASVDERHFSRGDQLRICDDRFIKGLRDLTGPTKVHGARVAIQLHHPGRQTRSSITGLQPMAPSAIVDPTFGEMPREMTVAEIEDLIERFAAAAVRAREAGFDAVQLHGAHGYLIGQFLSPMSNTRVDDYGGDIAGRARFATEVIRRCKASAGNDFPIMLRVSGDEHMPGGLTIDETRQIARLAVVAGADAIDVSGGHVAVTHWIVPPSFYPRAIHLQLAAAVKQAVSVPVVTAGRINDATLAERIIAEGQADMVAMGRGLIADPDLPRKAQAGSNRIRRCIACNFCLAGTVRCVVNPDVGREGIVETAAAASRKVIVVGAGPGGLEAARVARLRGHDVALWEASAKPGGRWAYLISGCIKDRLQGLRELGVSVSLGREISFDAVKAARPEIVLLAPSLVPRRGPFVAPDSTASPTPSVLTVDELLDGGKPAGQKVAVVGAGSAGCEAAQALLKRGASVTMVALGGPPGGGIESTHRTVLLQKMRQDGVQTITRAGEVRLIEGGLVVCRQDGEEVTIAVDTVVVALGYDRDDSLLEQLMQAGIEARPLPACEVPVAALAAMEEGGAIAREI